MRFMVMVRATSDSEAGRRSSKHGLQVITDVSQRERNPDETNRRMLDRDGDVQHVDIERVAVTFSAADAGAPRLDDLGTQRVTLHRRHALEGLRGVADDPSVRSSAVSCSIQKRNTRSSGCWLPEAGRRSASGRGCSEAVRPTSWR